MNQKASQWLQLAQWLRIRQQEMKRAAQAHARPILRNLPELSDREILAYIKKEDLASADLKTSEKFEIEVIYQAILNAPESEQEILEIAEVAKDKSRLDALYNHASNYSRWVEDEARREATAIKRAGVLGRWIQVTVLTLMLIIFGIGGWGYFTYRKVERYLVQPAGIQKGNVRVVIPRGARTQKVAALLEKAGVIRDKNSFFQLVRYYPYLRTFFPQLKRIRRVRLKAGTYSISSHLTPQQILGVLRKGPQRHSVRVVIPEGFNIWKIAARLHKKGITREEDFLRYAKDPDYARQVLGWDSPSLEGYLYPDTYRFYKNTSPEKIIQKMVRRFKSVFTRTFKRRAQELGWSIHQSMTMASIIEKETGQARERSKISSVFHNRLRRRWKLETDPTVIYGLLPAFNGNITSKDLHNPHPYNTYKHRGLPPGPIASPGLAAIRAALYPLKTRYMFFVSKNDGSHIFSRTGKEHRKWVQIYQRSGKKKKKKKRKRRR